MLSFLFLLFKYQLSKNELLNSYKKIKSRFQDKKIFKFNKEDYLNLYMFKNYLEIFEKSVLYP